jgi:hypothetical protein
LAPSLRHICMGHGLLTVRCIAFSCHLTTCLRTHTGANPRLGATCCKASSQSSRDRARSGSVSFAFVWSCYCGGPCTMYVPGGQTAVRMRKGAGRRVANTGMVSVATADRAELSCSWHPLRHSLAGSHACNTPPSPHPRTPVRHRTPCPLHCLPLHHHIPHDAHPARAAPRVVGVVRARRPPDVVHVPGFVRRGRVRHAVLKHVDLPAQRALSGRPRALPACHGRRWQRVEGAGSRVAGSVL